MAEVHLTQSVLDHWPTLLIVGLIAYLTKQYFQHGLHKYPGPFLANFTDAWRAWDVSKNDHAETMIALHARYGPIVRTGPNTLDLADPALVPEIYGIHKGFRKTSFYETFRNLSHGQLTTSLLPARDERFHSALKRPIAQMYSLSSVAEYEPLVDAKINEFITQLDTRFGRGDIPCDLGRWLHYMAFDLILHMTFGSTLGFLEQGADASGFIAALEANFDEIAVCTQMPWTRWIKRHNPLRAYFARDGTVFPRFVRQQMVEHQAKLASEKEAESRSGGGREGSERDAAQDDQRAQGLGAHGADFLTRFLQLRGVDPGTAVIYSLSNVIAGSDTTAITLRATVYFLLKHPATYQRLMGELRAAELSSPVTWKESQALPYLGAVISEALRLFPAVGLSLEREVPSSGLHLPGSETVIPPGTAVGMNPWVVHRDANVFGPLPTAEFRPERWLAAEGEAQEQFDKRRSAMQRAELAFGHVHSSRVCIGRHIAALEIYKLIPTLLLEFDLSLVEPEREWSYVNRWFVRQTGLKCWVKRRVR